jgi:hypothetical protein
MCPDHAPVSSAYIKHDYIDEKRAALNAWSREIERILDRGEAKVLAFR